jgi:hypothetical protein
MSTSERKIAANRINGRKSNGPTNTISTRFNATRHGLLAAGITELDDAEGYRALLNELRKEKAPVGIVETMYVESIALDIIRLQRARRLEAEYITSELNPPLYEPGLDELDLFKGALLDPGLPGALSFGGAQRLVTIYQRYETNISIRLSRNFNELERLQRMRKGEKLPAPRIVDLRVHASESSLPEPVETPLIESDTVPIEEQSKCLSGEVNVIDADTEIVDSVPEPQ